MRKDRQTSAHTELQQSSSPLTLVVYKVRYRVVQVLHVNRGRLSSPKHQSFHPKLASEKQNELHRSVFLPYTKNLK